jgi:(2R)-ethylmalonyl-CoA mutase
LQLPAWNEALSLPRPWDQQWSLRIQQVLAYETDLLDYPDLLEGSHVIESKVSELKELAYEEIDKVLKMGGGLAAVESGYMKSALVGSQSLRMERLTSGEQIVVGKNRWTEGLVSPLVKDADGGIFMVDTKAASRTLEALEETRQKRDPQRAEAALKRLVDEAKSAVNLMPASIECAKARVTTGEWSDALRSVFGEYRPPTGVDGQSMTIESDNLKQVRNKIDSFIEAHGYRPRIVVGKPGLDGHSNGAEMIAVAARHAGFDVIYFGIRLSTTEIVQSALEEDADIIGISLLSGSHNEIVKQLFDELESQGVKDAIPVVLGGIIPEPDFPKLIEMGVKRIFTPKDFDPMLVMDQIMDVINEQKALVAG